MPHLILAKEMRKIFTPILLCAALAGCSDNFTQKQRRSAKEVEGLIHRSGSLVIYSLDPQRHEAPPLDNFYGYKIIGQKEVTDFGDRKELLNKLAESIRQSTGWVAACFNPRHGLRFKENDTQIDLVICFECNSSRAYGTTHNNILLTGVGNSTFNTFLDKSQIQRSKK